MSGSLVIGIDSSTQSTKAIAFNRAGEAVAEGRADIPMANPQLDFYEQDPNDWWKAALTAIRGCTEQLSDTSVVEGIAISNQRETLAFLDENNEHTRPAILWLDERCREQVVTFSQRFGAERIHAITGRMPDMTSCLYTFAWMQEHQPDIYERTAKFIDVQSYLVQKLCGGDYRTGWISADPMGIVDMQTQQWSTELLQVLSLDASRLPAIHPPGTELGQISTEIASQIGLMAGTRVFAAGGDGQCAGLGVNCTVPDRAYINLGTAVVSGMWSQQYKYDKAWRTELAAQGEGYILETCLRSGAFLINWFVDQFVALGGKATADDFNKLEAAASLLPIGADGLLIQPYFGGSMDPHWDAKARGVILGLGASHSPAHLYRALLEGITLDQAMRTEDMERAAEQHIDHLVAIGGGANSALWTQMLADACGKPVHISTTVEASALGAAMIAACGAGWYDSITHAANAMCADTTVIEPDPVRHQQYQALLAIYRKVYQSTREINHELMAFSDLLKQAQQ